jgi:hypothetical protein
MVVEASLIHPGDWDCRQAFHPISNCGLVCLGSFGILGALSEILSRKWRLRRSGLILQGIGVFGPHDRDLFEPWTQGRFFPGFFSRTEVESVAESKMILSP